MTLPSPIFLNLDAIEQLCSIYRFVPARRFFALFEEKENVAVSPAKWDDPFENFLSRVPGTPRQHWYGQCWTRKRASDAMWRIYSPHGGAIRMRTSPEKLGSASRNPDHQVFVGRVEYPSERQIEAAFRFASNQAISPRDAARTLLIKRRAFQHEGEIRLLIHPKAAESKADVLRYPVDPHALVDALTLDPRLSVETAEKLKREIRERTGFQGKIKRSLLYQPPEIRWKA